MKRIASLLALTALLVNTSALSQTFVDVIDPVGNPSLWDLEWLDGSLYATNTSDDNVLEIDLVAETTSPVFSLSFDPRGLAWDGTNWRVSTGFDSSSPEIHTISPTGTNLGTIPAPSELTHGLELNDGLLFASRAYPDVDAAIAGVDPTTGAENETIDFPETQPGGIAFIDANTFWATNVGDDGSNIEKLYEIDRTTGSVLQELDLPDGAGRPRGLAYDGSQFLYLVVREVAEYLIYVIDLGTSGNADITLSAESLDFGPSVFGSSHDLPLTIGNIGDGDLEISNVQVIGPNAALFSTDLTATTIPAAGSEPYAVSFSPTEYGPRNATLSFETNDVTRPLVEIDLSGVGIYADQHILIEPAGLDFGEVRVDPSGQRSAIRLDLNVINGGALGLTVSDMTANDGAFSVLNTVFPFGLATLDTMTVEVEFRPTEVRTYNAILTALSDDPSNPNAEVALSGEGIQPDLVGGDVVWMMETPDNPNTDFDDPKIFSIVVPGDLTGDGIADLVFASSNYLVWAVDGNGWGETSILWSFNTCPDNNNCGAVSGNSQLFEYGMTTGEDFDDDGVNDVVIGTEGGNDHVYVLSGVDGSVIWKVGSDTDPYLASYYSVSVGTADDIPFDINNDGVLEVATGTGSASAQSPNPFNHRRVYLLDGLTGNILWERQTSFPNFRTIAASMGGGAADPIPLVVSGGGENDDNSIEARLADSGDLEWSVDVSYTPFLLERLPDDFTAVVGDDIIASGLGGPVQRIDVTSGDIVWTAPSGGSTAWDLAMVKRDAFPYYDVAVGSNGPDVKLISGETGSGIWEYTLGDQTFDVAAVPDSDGDEFQEVAAVGKSGRAVLLAGSDGSLIWDFVFGDGSFDQSGEVVVPVPDIDGNGVAEVAFGTYDGRAYLLYGGGDPIIVSEEPEAAPATFVLHAAYPNPFNPTTTIMYDLPDAASPSFTLFDALGRRVWEQALTDQPAGQHTLQLDGSQLTSGLYFVQMRAGSFAQTQSITLIK